MEAGRRELKLLDDVDRGRRDRSVPRVDSGGLLRWRIFETPLAEWRWHLMRQRTRAAFRRLRESVRKRREVIDAAKAQREKYVEWLDSFEEVVEVLTAEQETAVQHFTREYGPRTSVIQKRLRSVYGFGEIEILSEDSKIKVRARRGTEELRPTDYFSQSQQQTLLLGFVSHRVRVTDMVGVGTGILGRSGDTFR